MHFYTKGGEARHYVEMKTKPGQLRPTRITDAKKQGWIPSVTTIMNVLSKDALANWKVDQHLEQAFYVDSEAIGFDEWKKLVKRATREKMDEAPQAGTNVHDSLERYFLGEDYPREHVEIIKNTVNALPCEGVWIPEASFAHPLGYAGMCDLHSLSAGWVIDFKTKQTKDKFKPGKMAYPDHARQLSAYREGLGMPNAQCANIFICIETGEVDFHPHNEEDLQRGWRVFSHALAIWKEENYDPSFNKEEAA